MSQGVREATARPNANTTKGRADRPEIWVAATWPSSFTLYPQVPAHDGLQECTPAACRGSDAQRPSNRLTAKLVAMRREERVFPNPQSRLREKLATQKVVKDRRNVGGDHYVLP